LKQNIDKFPPPPNKNSTRSFTLPLIAEHKFQEGFEENEMPVEFQKVRDFGKAKVFLLLILSLINSLKF